MPGRCGGPGHRKRLQFGASLRRTAVTSPYWVAPRIAACGCLKGSKNSDERQVARTEVRSKESEASHRNRGRGWMKNGWLHVGTLTQRRPRTSWRETLVASWLSVQHEGASYGFLWHL